MKLALGLILILLTACGEPTLDTTLNETLKISAQKVIAELSSEEQQNFGKTIIAIYTLEGMLSYSRVISADET